MTDPRIRMAYLSGAMEYSPDKGAGWRTEIYDFLVRELNHGVFNPCIEQGKLLSKDELDNMPDWKRNNLPFFRKAINKIIKNDIDTILNKADYLICLWDEYVLNGGGTQGEITTAHCHGIPVYIVSKMSHSQISGWILGCSTEIFPSFNDLKEFLLKKFTDNI
jgi:hypothetical protein